MTTDALARPVKTALEEIQNFSLLVGRTFVSFVRPPGYWRDTFVQMDVIGVQSLSIV